MSSFSVGKKLIFGVASLMALTFALGLTALVSIRSGGQRVHQIVDVTVRQLTLAQTINIGSSFTMAAAKGILMRGLQHDLPKIQLNVDDYNTFEKTIYDSIHEMRTMEMKPEVSSALNDMEDATKSYRAFTEKLLSDSRSGDMAAAFDIYNNELKPLQLREQKDVTQMANAQSETLRQVESSAEGSSTAGLWMTGILLALVCALGVAFIFVIHQIIALMRSSVNELAQSAVQITSAAGQVSSSSQSLAQGSSEQAATIEETSSASTEINSMAHRNTENSSSAAEMVTRSGQGFDRANQSLAEMVSAMDGIDASSQKISKIIKVIDEIAFQTNILALNAAVEAARAGEAGMGFAVVADEVRNLAQRCAQAAKDTADLIEESIRRSSGGKHKVDEVAGAIRDITTEAVKIKEMVDEINLGSVEQSRGIDQIARSISQMEQVTQSNAANAEQSAAAAEQLNAQAEAMKDIVKSLRAMVDGAADGTSVARHAGPSLRLSTEKLQKRLAPASLAKAMPITKASSQAKVSSTVKRSPLVKTVTRIKSAVKLPTIQSAAPVSAKAAAIASFPMDDDFKEF
jgi:methyl-accepting chemotaxis protein/methyl-accepting chemotaxis protein-1 (serine sensor receptor)